jgi:hypothetical protein
MHRPANWPRSSLGSSGWPSGHVGNRRFWPGFGQFHDSRPDLSALDNEFTHRNGQLESPGPATTGVDVQNAISFFDQGLVRMARNNDLHACGMRLDVELRKIVDDVDECAPDSNHLRFRQMGCPPLPVIVTSDGNQRRHGGKLIENLGRSDVSAMNDVIAADCECSRFSPHEPMCI